MIGVRAMDIREKDRRSIDEDLHGRAYNREQDPPSGPNGPSLSEGTRRPPIFMFADLEDSTRKLEEFRDVMADAIVRLIRILEEQVKRRGGEVIQRTGDGILAKFEDGNPLECAIDIQRQVRAEDWGEIGKLRVRVALNAGVPEVQGEVYVGRVINRTKRIMDAGWGDQILLTYKVLYSSRLPHRAKLKDHKLHRFQGLDDPVHIFELKHPDLQFQEFPPLKSISSESNVRAFERRPPDHPQVRDGLNSVIDWMRKHPLGVVAGFIIATLVAAFQVVAFNNLVFTSPHRETLLIATNFLVLTPETQKAFGADLEDIGGPLDFETKNGSIRSVSGPMEGEQVKEFFKFVKDPPDVALYVDLDYFSYPEKKMGIKNVLKTLSLFANENWDRYHKIKAVIFGE